MNLWTVGCADPRLTAPARSPMDKPGKTPMRFPRLAHRSAAAHKLHSTPQQDRMNLISGKGETSAGYRPLAYSSPEAVQTTGTVALDTNDDSDGPATMVFGPVPVPVPPPVPDPVPVTPLPVVVVLPEVVGMVPVPRTMQAAAVHEPVPVVVVMTTSLLTVTVFVIV